MSTTLGGVGGVESKDAMRLRGPRIMRTPVKPAIGGEQIGNDERIAELESGMNTLQLAVTSLQQQVAELRGTLLREQDDDAAPEQAAEAAEPAEPERAQSPAELEPEPEPEAEPERGQPPGRRSPPPGFRTTG